MRPSPPWPFPTVSCHFHTREVHERSASVLKVRNIGRGAVAVGLCLLVSRCAFLPEASFELAKDSRLPKWFSIPPPLTRSQVSVRMDYYIPPWGRRATFTMMGPGNHVIAKVTGTVDGDEPKTLSRKSAGSNAAFPSYEVVTVSGVTDIVEHRKTEPLFCMSDDPKVWAALVKKP